jgi:hypothetical protein
MTSMVQPVPALGKALRTVRKLMAPDGKKLTSAIAEVQRLNGRYNEIRAELSRKVDTSAFDQRVKVASAEYARQPTPENLEALIMSEIVQERAVERIAPLRRSFNYGNAAFDQWAHEFPAWRQTLETTCQLRLDKAKAELSAVTAQEGKRLGQSYSADEVEHSPPVRRAASAVQQWEFRLKKIQTDVIEVAWSQNAAAVIGRR